MTHSLSLQGMAGHELSVVTSSAVDPVDSLEPIVLLHGFPLDHRMWAKQLEATFPGKQVVVPELRGFGRSTLLGDGYSIRELADDVEIVRQRVCGGKPIHLCGLSMGGYVAFEYWKNYAANLRSLILANTKPEADTVEMQTAREELASRVVREGSWKSLQGMLPKLMAPGRPKEAGVVADVAQMISDARPSSVAAASRAMAKRSDFTAELHKIETPTLVITGEFDVICPPQSTQTWAAQIAGGKYSCIRDAGHLTPLESPKAFNHQIDAFVNR